MATCSYQTTLGRPCRRNAVQDGMCRQHWNVTHEAIPPQTPPRRVQTEAPPQNPQTPPPLQNRPIPDAPLRIPRRPITQRTPQEQERVRASNQILINHVPNMGPQEIIGIANVLIDVWLHYEIPSLVVPAAYTSLKFLSIRHPFFQDLLQAAVQLVLLDSHPVFVSYTFVPLAERQQAIEQLRLAVELIGNGVPDHDERDWRYPLMLQRMEAILLAPPPAPPVERDPEGGINLQAFATDPENVHRSSVQDMARNQIQHILQIPFPDEQDTMLEIHRTYDEPTLHEIRQNCLNVECFGIGYRQLLNHVWAYIRSHEEKEELEKRLGEEVLDGVGTCPNGKMCRLVNTLQGYYDMPAGPSREAFQSRMATLRGQPNALQTAQEVFEEFRIPETERQAWLDTLQEVE
jgi:hypothetical protein